MRTNNRERTYLRPKERTYLRPRDPSIDRDRLRDQGPHSSGTEAGADSMGNQSALSLRLEDHEKKEKLLNRLQSLGLAPKKYGNKLRNTTTTTRKRISMTKGREKNGVFFRPLIFECSHCNKLFFHKIILKVHKKKHFPKFRCSECYKCFKNEVVYHRHVKQCQKSN